MSSILADKAMLVMLNITSWSASAQDKSAAAEVAAAHQAAPEVGRYTKRLLAKEAMQEVNALTRELRSVHEQLTLPWTDSGYRLLPVDSYPKYRETIDQLLEDRVAARQELARNLPRYIQAAQAEMGSLFEPELYPAPEELEALITAEYKITPVPDGEHFVADLAQEEADRIRRQIDHQNEANLAAAMNSLYRRLGQQIAECARQLQPPAEGEKAAALREATLNNLKQLAQLIPDQNLTGDPELDTVCLELRALLKNASTDNLLKSSPNYDAAARSDLAAKMNELNRKFAGYIPQE